MGLPGLAVSGLRYLGFGALGVEKAFLGLDKSSILKGSTRIYGLVFRASGFFLYNRRTSFQRFGWAGRLWGGSMFSTLCNRKWTMVFSFQVAASAGSVATTM